MPRFKVHSAYQVGLRVLLSCVVIVAFTLHLAHVPLEAANLPSVFRGVVVADSQIGVRVVSIDPDSQASLGDLRPEDIIVRVQDQDVRSIDDFAVVSRSLRGHSRRVHVLVFRNGTPRDIDLHLYSYPVLRVWGIEFVPVHDIRFADSKVGAAYWKRMGRGFEEAGKAPLALDAYLNALHNVPDDMPSAMKTIRLSARAGQRKLSEGDVLEGITVLRQTLLMIDELFDHSLTGPQLAMIRDELRATLVALRGALRGSSSPLSPRSQPPMSLIKRA